MKADEVELKSTINLALISEDEDLDLIPDEAAIGPDSFDIVAIAISSMRRERGRERERGCVGVEHKNLGFYRNLNDYDL